MSNEEVVEEPARTAGAPGRGLRHPFVRFLLVGLVGAVAGVTAMSMTSDVQGRAGPGEVSVGATLSRNGGTGVALPPFGRITADTHDAPVRLDVRVDSVDVDRIQGALDEPSPQTAIETDVRADLPPLLRAFVGRALLAALFVGGTAGILVSRRHWTYGLAGALGGVLGVSSMLGVTWIRYDVQAFEEARFTGALERAPMIMATVRQHVDGLEVIEDRVRVVSQQVAGLYAATETEPGADQTLVLHVSDIHSNPLGMELTKKLAQSFNVDAVLDTGDITSFGLPVEARIVDLIDDLDVPYLLVPGNHDSQENRASLVDAPQITVLDGTTVDVGDVRILGVADPSYTADNRMSTREANDLKRARADDVARLVEDEEPDLLAVHHLLQADEVDEGAVETVVAGHNHERTEENRGGTLLLTVGSTGATGLGSFTVESSQGYEAQVLRYRGTRLVAVDYVTLGGVSGSFEIDRRVVTSEDRGQPSDGPDRRDAAGGVELSGVEGTGGPDGAVSRAGRAAPARSGRRAAGS